MTPSLLTPKQLEDVARALCARRRVDSCAAICMSHLSGNREPGSCPEAVRVFGEDVRAAIAALPPEWLALIAAAIVGVRSQEYEDDVIWAAKSLRRGYEIARSTKETTDAD